MIEFLAARAGGDARAALNALELALLDRRATGEAVTLADAEDAMQRKAVLYDKGGDQHYDYISAWIKSTRGSDPDASLYYLAAMLEGGEDARFIARRMIILASEDIGNADPQALPIAVAAAHAVEHVGLPEGQFALAQAAIYLSLAPKSNAVKRAIGAARATSATTARRARPRALRSAAYPGAPSSAAALGYDYPHDHPGHVNDQEHLPDGLGGPALLRPATTRSRAARAAGADPPRPRACRAGSRAGMLRPSFIRGALSWSCDMARDPTRPPCGAPFPVPGRAARAHAHGRAAPTCATGRPRCSSAAACAADRPRPAAPDARAFDPARRHVLCALAPLDGAVVLAGRGRDRLRRATLPDRARGRRPLRGPAWRERARPGADRALPSRRRAVA